MNPLGEPLQPSFCKYVLSRRYRSGRTGKLGWQFVLIALGDEEILAASSWRKLREILLRLEYGPEVQKGASDVWRSYTALVRNLDKTTDLSASHWPVLAKQICS